MMDSSILPVLENQLKQIWTGKSKTCMPRLRIEWCQPDKPIIVIVLQIPHLRVRTLKCNLQLDAVT
jgi:hypothetical protein